MPAPTSLTRRDAVRLGLLTSGSALLVACTRASGGDTEPTAPGGPDDPDRALRAEIGAQESALIALYAAAVAKLSGGEAKAVAALGARHDAYRQAIDPDGLATAAPTGSPSPSPSRPSPSPSTSLPSSSTGIVAALRKAERGAASARLAQSLRAVDGELARVVVLAGTGAAGAAEVLSGGVG
ncbi:MAG: hypothetical protein U0S36_11755 [Candidatus Nanopelagicales bacterium]